ncbi:MAG: 50S ribosomal protein L10 [Actinomycetota bacterium]|nr:50S ribosomal protein L10 [Actinomycetota bacterium]
MPKPEKIQRVAELKARIEASDALLLTEYRGLTVSDISALRRSLAEGGTRFAVVKNTLMRRAVVDSGMAELQEILEGPSAVAFVVGDPVAAAKKVVDAAKQFPALVLKGGFLDGNVLSADEAKGLAELESREVMLSKIAGMLKSDMSRAAAMFVSTQSKFLSLLEAFKDKLQSETPPDSPTEAVAVEPTTTADTAETTADTAETTADTAETVADETATEESEERPDEGSTDVPEPGPVEEPEEKE